MLLIDVLTLKRWRLTIVLIVFPVQLFVCAQKLRQLLTVDAKHLISELFGHVCDHGFDPVFLQCPPVERDGV